MNDKDNINCIKDNINCIKSIMFKLMFGKVHQISNSEDAYIEHEIRLTEDEYKVAYGVFNTVIHFLSTYANVECNMLNDFEYIARQNWHESKKTRAGR